LDKSLAVQVELCRRYGVAPTPVVARAKVGIARNVRDGLLPLNGLRHPVAGDTSGWYIWAGEKMSDAPDFFVPLHVEHVAQWCPAAIKFLALPPGWRFLVAGDYEDVWRDDELLCV
jgi:hypothetical protein